MNRVEIEWLEEMKKNPSNYKIVVDNDSVWIDSVADEDCVFQFNEFGQDFIVSILNHMGFNAEHC
jgi:hypothetical protein